MTTCLEPEVFDAPGHHICPKCGSLYEDHTQGLPKCTVCTRFETMCSNANKSRRSKAAPGIDLALADFANWYSMQPHRCFYCGITEASLESLGLRTMVGRYLRRFGVDRLTGSKPYRLDNIVLCCFACNATKSDRFTVHEMISEIGPSLGRVFQKRLRQVEFKICRWQAMHPGEDPPGYAVVWDEEHGKIALGVRNADGSGYSILDPEEDDFDDLLSSWAPKVVNNQLPLPWFQVS